MEWVKGIVVLLTVIGWIRTEELPTCQPKDFHYQLTPCEEGGRWRVSLPSPGVCVGGAPSPPVLVNPCSRECKLGEFFNVTSLNCESCAPGTYSVGNGAVYNAWSVLPKAFTSESEHFSSPTGGSLLSSLADKSECTARSGWQPKNSHISFFGGPCVASLYLTVNMVRPGTVSTVYQYPDDDVIFEFQADDDRCKSFRSNDDEKRWPPITEEGSWSSHKVALPRGTFKLTWRAVAASSRSTKPLRIKSIEIQGTAEMGECYPCPAGSYADEPGSGECKKCPANQISAARGVECSICPSDEYASDESDVCLTRPACMSADFYEVYSQCDKNNQTKVEYRWLEPKICRSDVIGAEQLPVKGRKRECPPCNPGMEFSGVTGSCEFCQKGWFSDGTGSCNKCPISTSPNTGLRINWWNSDLPSFIDVKCMSFEGYGCGKALAWQPKGNYIQSGNGHKPDVYLVLSLKVSGGFKVHPHNLGRGPVGVVTFSFETRCKQDCELVFMTASPGHGINVIQSWRGSQSKQEFTFQVNKNDSYVFSWAFQKVAWDTADREKRGSARKNLRNRLQDEDEARVFDIQVLNTNEGGASSCVKCLKGAEKSGCTTCPPGRYFQINTTECIACPEGTIASQAMPFGQASCEACVDGLAPVDDRSKCASDCKPRVGGVDFDFSKIGAKSKEVLGSRLFTTAGMQYSHIFNMSFCGSTTVLCKNNVSSSGPSEGSKSIKALICRSTLIPSSSGEPVSTQAVSLGDTLLGFSRNAVLKGIEVLEEFRGGVEKNMDLYAFFSSSGVTRACPKGRTTTVTLRCDPKASVEGTVHLPTRCPDGTCDGCSFHFLWVTASACPVCTLSDYKLIKGECLSGKQVLHYLPSQTCQLPADAPVIRILPCSSHIPASIQFIIVITVALTLVLCLVLLFVWKRTRRLEYKYMKLIASTKPGQGQHEDQGGVVVEGELPAAESCGLQEGEEEEVSVTIPVRSAKILHKIKSAYQKRTDTGSFETVRLTDKM